MMRAADALCVVGIGMIGYGLWLVHPSLMWTVIGAMFVGLGVWHYIHSQEPTK